MDEIREGIFIGDIDDARRDADTFDSVLTLCALAPDTVIEPDRHIELWDGRNDSLRFEEAVQAAIDLIEADGDVLVHCAAGQSRSAAVLATALAVLDDETFGAKQVEIANERPQIAIHPELRKHGKDLLGEDGSVYKNPFPEDQ